MQLSEYQQKALSWPMARATFSSLFILTAIGRVQVKVSAIPDMLLEQDGDIALSTEER